MMANNFLKSLPFIISDEGLEHYNTILDIIYNKFMNPEQLESKFVTCCFNEDWEKALWVADTRNKEAMKYNIIQDLLNISKLVLSIYKK